MLCIANCFMFYKDIGIATKKVHEKDFESNTMQLARAAQIIWKEFFENRNSFTGSFSEEYHNENVSSSLVELINMTICVPEIKDRSADVASTVCAKYEIGSVVCPRNLVKNVFTTGTLIVVHIHKFIISRNSNFHYTIIQHPSSEDDPSLHTVAFLNAETQGK